MAADLLLWDRLLERLPNATPPCLLLFGLTSFTLTSLLILPSAVHFLTHLLQLTTLSLSLSLLTLSRKAALRNPIRWSHMTILDQCVSGAFTTPVLYILLTQVMSLNEPFYVYLGLLSVATPSLLATWEQRYLKLTPDPGYWFLALMLYIALTWKWYSDTVPSWSILTLTTYSAWTLPSMMARVMSYTKSLRPLIDLFPVLIVLISLSYLAFSESGNERLDVILVSSGCVLGTAEVKMIGNQSWLSVGLLVYVSLILWGCVFEEALEVYWWGVSVQVVEEVYCVRKVVTQWKSG